MSDDDYNDDTLGNLYRAGAQEQPSADIDRRILEAAARQAQPQVTTTATAGRPRRLLWRPLPAAAFATAAVVVLAVGLLLRMQPATDPQGAPPAAPPAPRAEAQFEAMERRARSDMERDPPAELGNSFAPAEDSGIEEIVVTAQHLEAPVAAADQQSRRELRALRASSPALEPALSLTSRSCAEPYPLPAGVTLQTLADGARVSVGDLTFTVRCEDGTWVRRDVQSSR